MTAGPRAVLLFGVSATGKSTVAAAFAASMPRCAHIEVDVLRYMIVGGLVASSRGTSPAEDPAGYREQCLLGVDNAVRLAHGFATRGFSSVIEGLEDEQLADVAWQRRAFEGLAVTTALLVCDHATLARRRTARGWGAVPADTEARVDAWRAACGVVIDTSDGSVERAVAELSRAVGTALR